MPQCLGNSFRSSSADRTQPETDNERATPLHRRRQGTLSPIQTKQGTTWTSPRETTRPRDELATSPAGGFRKAQEAPTRQLPASVCDTRGMGLLQLPVRPAPIFHIAEARRHGNGTEQSFHGVASPVLRSIRAVRIARPGCRRCMVMMFVHGVCCQRCYGWCGAQLMVVQRVDNGRRNKALVQSPVQ